MEKWRSLGYQFLLCFTGLLVAGSHLHSQGRDSARVLGILNICCDNGFGGGQWCDASSGMTLIDYDCNEVQLLVYDCVDATRDLRFCSYETNPGTPWCVEAASLYEYDTKGGPNGHPRYYVATPIQVSPAALYFSGEVGGSNPSSQSFTISNGVSDVDPTLNWTASADAGWLSLSPSSGQVSSSISVTVSPSLAGLSVGTYVANITVSATEVSSRQNGGLQVTLTVQPINNLSVAISGPINLDFVESGTWTAEVSGGTAPYSYTWWRMNVCNSNLFSLKRGVVPNSYPCDQWAELPMHTASITTSGMQDFKLRVQVTDAGEETAQDEIYVSVGALKSMSRLRSVARASAIPVKEQVSNNRRPLYGASYPNPFNPSTTIKFELPQETRVLITVYDLWGRCLRTLVDGRKPKGVNTIEWDGHDARGMDVSSGVYLCRIQAPSLDRTIKMTLVR